MTQRKTWRRLETLVLQVSGDGQHQARCDRREQAEGGHAGGGEQDRGVQEGQPRHLQLGDQGETGEGRYHHPTLQL